MDPSQHGFDPYADTAGFDDLTGSLWGNIKKGISKAAKGLAHVASKVATVAVKQALPLAQSALSNIGPVGMIANGALTAMQAGLSGKSLANIALAAAHGAAPSSIRLALGAAQDLAAGKSVLNSAMHAAQSHFLPGSGERFAFDAATQLLKKGAPREGLGVARRALTNEGQRRAFDAAVGTLAQAATKASQRPGPPRIVMQRAKSSFKTRTRNDSMLRAALANRPGLATKSVATIARTLGARPGQVRDALRSAPAALPWRGVSGGATAFIRRHVPHSSVAALWDTGALNETGETYVVESGDFPGKIAQKLSGSANKWPALIAANPQKKTKKTSIGKEFVSLFAGEKLIVPVAWRKPVIEVVAPPLLEAAPATPVNVLATTASIVQAKAILAAWSKTDGLTQSGVTDFGQRPEDLSTTWGPRDVLTAASFERWANARGGALDTDGDLSPSLTEALRTWAEQRAQVPVPVAPLPLPVLAVPSALPPVSSPMVVATSPAEQPVVLVEPPPGALTFPTPGGPVTLGPAPSLPQPVVTFDPNPVLDFPEMVITGDDVPVPAAAVAVVPPKPKKKGDDGMILALAGAGGGFLAAGPVGAIVGGLGGLLLSA